jgi:flagellar biosynthetic protein FlhB
MADDQDQSSKTEEPTERKLRRLREEGQVPTSREVNSLFALLGMLVVVGLVLPWSMGRLGTDMVAMLADAGTTPLDGRASIGAVLTRAGLHALVMGLPLLLALLVAGYAGSIIQNGFIFSGHSLIPNLEKISPLAGLKRLFSLKSLAEFIKAILKMGLIGAGMGLVLWDFRHELVALAGAALPVALGMMHRLTLALVAAALALMVVLALVDYLFQRMQWMMQNRMSHRELKDEMRESEGDPHIKQRQRQIRNERARRRMMAAVPKADVVITNPTHYSVALRYKPDEGDEAPVVVAKGMDHVALRIREIAAEHDIPFYEDAPLARQLYAMVEIDQAIPLELYEVVAQVIVFIMQLRERRRRAA